ncbi:SDR family oxidoreductase [Nocardia huaxiensis]|uniref:3-oxoacyl-[acyl-carrier-protein] reductase MabA n=1 Tax=Nocardia huaxiensis TaxID=2755382 RepID=A0A7D6V8C9_9NOCA|nr:SDR family oxidoreductase [Nocardia huaxiensis]QLY28122.1 SDR family oxidoreductase [Nocardia huaxiensis]UFS98436.1 SDR family oxidoreductase [Nocardia huaxiensis]
MDLGISGRIALVLGGGGGLGGAIAETLAAEGAAVAVADIDKRAAETRAEAIVDRGGRAEAFEWNIADLHLIDDRVAAIERSLGPVDILINNTGGPAPSPVTHQPTGTWAEQFLSMVLSVIAITDAVLPGMRARGWGRVITSTSSGVIAPIPNLGLSNTLRSSLLGWSKTLAREVAADGITANVVIPGRIGTARTEYLDRAKAERDGIDIDQVRAASTAAIPVGRYGEPSEYAAAIAFLAGVPAAYITGTVVRVDGGLIASV